MADDAAASTNRRMQQQQQHFEQEMHSDGASASTREHEEQDGLFHDHEKTRRSKLLLPVTPIIHESHTRSIVKGLTWRILATTTTTIIAWLITGKIDTALQIGFFEFFAKLAIYYAHERAWTYVRL